MNFTEYKIGQLHNTFCLPSCTCKICYNNGHATIFYTMYCKDCIRPLDDGRSKEQFRQDCGKDPVVKKEIDEQVEVELTEKDIYHKPYEALHKLTKNL